MVKLNFLPHRAIRQKERQQQFYGMLCAALVVGGASVLGVSMLLDEQIAQQTLRVQALQASHGALDARLRTMADLQQQMTDLVQRRQHVEAVRQQQNQTTLLLQTLARTTPSNVQLRALKQQATRITLSGSAASPEDALRLLSNLRSDDESGVFQNAELQEMRATPAHQSSSSPDGFRHDFIISAISAGNAPAAQTSPATSPAQTGMGLQ